MYFLYIAVLGSGILLRSTSCIHAVVRVGFLALIAMDGMYAGFAGAKACHKKITIFKGTLGKFNSRTEVGPWIFNILNLVSWFWTTVGV